MNAAGSADRRFTVVVGSGGVGKTTLAAALALEAARRGEDTLVMTFDPSLRLKDTLGIGDEALDREVEVDAGTPGTLHASLLDAGRTFDRLVERYATDDVARERILGNRYYRHLSGSLAGILEYMAVERLYEVAADGRYRRVILDTPPTRQALDFLEAPERIVAFLDSGALRLALKPWFDESGHLKGSSRLGWLGRSFEGLLDRVVGLGLLRDMAEFFQAFEPLYAGFRERAREVQGLLQSDVLGFVLVSGPDEDRIPDTMLFARRLEETGHRLDRVVVNRVHPAIAAGVDPLPADDPCAEATRVLRWLGERDARGVSQLRSLLPGRNIPAIPVTRTPPDDLASLEALAGLLRDAVAAQGPSKNHV